MQQNKRFGETLQRDVYCGLDSCLTWEILDALKPQGDEFSDLLYDFERALQAPVLEMELRGLLIDRYEANKLIRFYESQSNRVRHIINQLAFAVWDKPLNPLSPKQLKEFFYTAMGIPEITIYDKGQRRVSTNREALEKIENYRYARPTAKAILAVRDVAKKISVLKSGCDPDGRMRFSYNIGGTNTGRFSCNKNVRGGGTNGQNITDELRRVYIADPGKKFAYIDLQQAESRVVAYVSGDEKYINACESSDLHVYVARTIWPGLDWTDDPEHNMRIAKKKFWRHWSRRDLSKRGGHLCLTEDHEVLTPVGWVNIGNKPQIIMTWKEVSRGKRTSEFAKVINWIDEEFSGDLCSFEGNSISALTTPNHRIPYKSDQRTFGVKVKRAEDGPGAFMPLGSGYIGGQDIVPAKLIAAHMSDGHQNSKNRMVFHLIKKRKIERLYKLATEYGYEITKTGNKYKIWGNLPKKAGAYMLNWTKECLVDFIEEYQHWDGHIGPTSVTISSKDRDHLEWLQTFGRILGIGGNVGFHVELKGIKYWRLQQNQRLWASGKSVKFSKVTVTQRRVLCPTVPSEFFYIRRNGKIFITGNTNYVGQPRSNAKSLHISVEMMTEFQRAYLSEFSGIRHMHTLVAGQLSVDGMIITPLGRKRLFFGRNREDDVIRKGVAYSPQSVVGDLLNLGMLRVWSEVRSEINLMAQLHDAILVQYNESEEDRILARAKKLMTIPVEVTDIKSKGARTRTMVIPIDIEVGWNWAHATEENPGGLSKYSPGKEHRKRPNQDPLKRIM